PDIWTETNTYFRHSQFCRLSRHTVRTWRRDPYSPAKYQAIHDGDIRLWVVINPVIERVLVTKEGHRCGEVIVNSVVVDRYNVTTSTKPTVSGATDQHSVDIVVVFEFCKGLVNEPNHVVRECIHRFGAVER